MFSISLLWKLELEAPHVFIIPALDTSSCKASLTHGYTCDIRVIISRITNFVFFHYWYFLVLFAYAGRVFISTISEEQKNTKYNTSK